MFENFDLRKINSITKYPSILTYHQLGVKGRLKDELIETSIFDANDEINFYEKVDGENSRIVLIGNGGEVDYFIGSREEILYAKGDRVGNPYGNIAAFFKPIADKLAKKLHGLEGIVVTYLESYGGTTTKSKNYTNDKTQNGRLFDVFQLSVEEVNRLLSLELRHIASWRDNGGQPYFDCEKRTEFAKEMDLEVAPLLTTIKGSEMPKTIEDVYSWLEQFRETRVGINVVGPSEGVIGRTSTRSKITKIRFEDYERTLDIQRKK